jgi:hypothetical protein
MNLKNYTSSVPADTTISRIERILVDGGATGIAKEYEKGRVKALVFQIEFAKDQLPVTIKLPANVAGCQQAMWKEHCRTRSRMSRKTDADFLDQAERTAWKLQEDWVACQMSLIRLQQQDAMCAFLPYAFDGHRTVYEKVKESGGRLLLGQGGAS